MVYRFHDFTLDAARRELRRGGHLIALEPKVLQVLLYLVTHRDRVIPKTEAVPLLATLLALPLPAERYAPLTLSPQEQRLFCLIRKRSQSSCTGMSG